jgi:hypothetical protein
MIRGIFFFLLIFFLVYIGISLYRDATKRERLNFWKQVAYASIPAWAAMVVSLALVFFF